MKSIITIILINLFSILIAKPAFAQSIRVSLPIDSTGETSSSVALPIVVGDLTGRGVIAYQADITFDENVLDATGASSAGTLSGSFGPPTVNVSENGKISVGGFGTTALGDSGTLVNLIFNVIGQPGDKTALVFDNFVFNSGDPAAEIQNGEFVVAPPTSVRDEVLLPETFEVGQNFPNPFNPQTSIPFEVPAEWTISVRLEIFNLLGQPIKTLVDEVISPGRHVIVWKGKDASDEPVSSGFYFYKISSGDFVAVRKMLLVQ
ncbi:MAG: T9SS type A sorting domain-containing protein [Bacteroidetes bacterium]|nr:T9SS type A sorting domain-containing protein [Bacteroidota bacterium]